jgi:hypothetical protein
LIIPDDITSGIKLKITNGYLKLGKRVRRQTSLPQSFDHAAEATAYARFEPRNRNDNVPFDLTTFKYVPVSQAAEIPNKVKAEIVAILRETGAPI